MLQVMDSREREVFTHMSRGRLSSLVFLAVFLAFSAVSYAATKTDSHVIKLTVEPYAYVEVDDNEVAILVVFKNDEWNIIGSGVGYSTLTYATNVKDGKRITVSSASAGIAWPKGLGLKVNGVGVLGPAATLVGNWTAFEKIDMKLEYIAEAEMTVPPGTYTTNVIYTVVDK